MDGMENTARTVKHEAAPPQCSPRPRQDGALTLSRGSSGSHAHVEMGLAPQALLREEVEALLGNHYKGL